MTARRILVKLCLISLVLSTAEADELGKVDTKFRFLSPDDTIRIEAFADPKIDGVVCYLSRAQIGGYSGALGIAEDTSDAANASSRALQKTPCRRCQSNVGMLMTVTSPYAATTRRFAFLCHAVGNVKPGLCQLY